MGRILTHLRRNAVAYIALFVALGGTSYAAINLPAGSVGNRQLQNHAIDPVKLNPGTIAASIRAWANVTWDGGWRVQASSSDIRHHTNSVWEKWSAGATRGSLAIAWRRSPQSATSSSLAEARLKRATSRPRSTDQQAILRSMGWLPMGPLRSRTSRC